MGGTAIWLKFTSIPSTASSHQSVTSLGGLTIRRNLLPNVEWYGTFSQGNPRAPAWVDMFILE